MAIKTNDSSNNEKNNTTNINIEKPITNDEASLYEDVDLNTFLNAIEKHRLTNNDDYANMCGYVERSNKNMKLHMDNLARDRTMEMKKLTNYIMMMFIILYFSMMCNMYLLNKKMDAIVDTNSHMVSTIVAHKNNLTVELFCTLCLIIVVYCLKFVCNRLNKFIRRKYMMMIMNLTRSVNDATYRITNMMNRQKRNMDSDGRNNRNHRH